MTQQVWICDEFIGVWQLPYDGYRLCDCWSRSISVTIENNLDLSAADKRIELFKAMLCDDGCVEVSPDEGMWWAGSHPAWLESYVTSNPEKRKELVA